MRTKLFLLVSALALVFGAFTAQAADQTLIALGSTGWKFHLGTNEASTPTDAWRPRTYDDASWPAIGTPLGYGETGIASANTLPESDAITPTWLSVFLRKSFTVADPNSYSRLSITANCDDGFILWINGTRILAANEPSEPLTIASYAPSAIEPTVTTLEITEGIASLLVTGANVVAVQCFNANLTSSDLLWNLSLIATVDTEAPTVIRTTPFPGSTLRSLDRIEVRFSEPVTGVDVTDLIVDGSPATDMTLGGPDTFIFSFPPIAPASARVVPVSWSPTHGIRDLSANSNAFAGGSWTYTVDPNAPMADLRLNEFMAANAGSSRDDDGDSSDWIEIYNAANSDINLDGWFLSNDPTQLRMWRFPAVSMQPFSYLVVWASEKDRTNTAAPLHTNFKINKDGGSLFLVWPDGTNVASMFFPNYPLQYDDVSYGRDQLDPSIVGYFTIPTPGRANATLGAGFGPAVRFSRTAGTFTTAFSLTLSVPDPAAAEIRYFLVTNQATALVSNLPVASMSLYTGPIPINGTIQVRARAIPTQAGNFPGPLQSETYIQISSNAANFVSDIPIVLLHNFGGGVPTVEFGQSGSFGVMMVFDTNNPAGRAALTNTPDVHTRMGFHVRGSSTYGYSKRSFALEAYTEINGDDRNIDMLGMPADSDWAFYAPNYFDQLLFKNPFAHEVRRKLVDRYSCRTRMLEMFLNTTGGQVAYTPGATGAGMGDYYGIHAVL